MDDVPAYGETAKRVLKALLVQQAPEPNDLAANVEAVLSTLAAADDVELIVFPELFLCGYDLSTVGGLAIDLDGPPLGRIRAAAAERDVNVVLGLAERRTGRPANTAVAIDTRGEIAGLYRKTHLFGDEAAAFSAGDGLEPIPLAGRNFGVMICFDVEFPEVARALAARGANTLLTIAANMAPFGPDHEIASRARALENGLPHLYVNRVGDEGDLKFVGLSRSVSPWGRTLAEAGEQSCTLAVEVGEPGAADQRLDYAAQLRPELYDVPTFTAPS
jgi:predicted amidohydrolase